MKVYLVTKGIGFTTLTTFQHLFPVVPAGAPECIRLPCLLAAALAAFLPVLLGKRGSFAALPTTATFLPLTELSLWKGADPLPPWLLPALVRAQRAINPTLSVSSQALSRWGGGAAYLFERFLGQRTVEGCHPELTLC